MNPQVEVQIAIALANLLFLAGGAWFLVKQTKKDVSNLRHDVNGMGAKVRAHQAVQIAIEPDLNRRLELAWYFFGAAKK